VADQALAVRGDLQGMVPPVMSQCMAESAPVQERIIRLSEQLCHLAARRAIYKVCARRRYRQDGNLRDAQGGSNA
jgi:hypothetical protein